MVNLEQIKLLETKVGKAIEHLQRLSRENSLLREQEGGLKKRIDELEAEVKRYKENQSRIESGIVSALERLDQFEDTMVTLAGKRVETRPAEAGSSGARPAETRPPAETRTPAGQDTPSGRPAEDAPPERPAKTAAPAQAHGKKGSLLRSSEEIEPGEEAAETPDGGGQLDIF